MSETTSGPASALDLERHWRPLGRLRTTDQGDWAPEKPGRPAGGLPIARSPLSFPPCAPSACAPPVAFVIEHIYLKTNVGLSRVEHVAYFFGFYSGAIRCALARGMCASMKAWARCAIAALGAAETAAKPSSPALEIEAGARAVVPVGRAEETTAGVHAGERWMGDEDGRAPHRARMEPVRCSSVRRPSLRAGPEVFSECVPNSRRTCPLP
jgi:hypothetical protein